MNNDNGLHFAHQWYWHNPFLFWLIDSKVISTIWVWLIGRPVSKGLNRSKGCTFYILHFTRLTDLDRSSYNMHFDIDNWHGWHCWHLTLLTFDIVDIWYCCQLTLLSFDIVDIWNCWHLKLLTFDIVDK